MSSVMLEMDPNNNAQPGEKSYSLRPRLVVKRSDEEEEETITWRRRPKRRQKPKPAPLSKYRRKTANARERSRMREINEAFDSLRRAVPHSITRSDQAEKLTKISTLRLAMKYIAALSAALAEPQTESDVESLISDSTINDLSTSESSLTPPFPPLSVLDASFSDPYSDFSDSALPLDPYTDFSAFVLDDPFASDFS
ncbi:helix-loop-helix protein delilah-like [Cimex lectularius]|uniref:BHLH domain-containing protein n=1 Tax=Cimex lectularius TaxID=79782 RepID=A0A8I6TB92_CIMLE|nr:helix-loop-helix protein delilah-like [Cimex lectularius]